jgi:hypothetical protein
MKNSPERHHLCAGRSRALTQLARSHACPQYQKTMCSWAEPAKGIDEKRGGIRRGRRAAGHPKGDIAVLRADRESAGRGGLPVAICRKGRIPSIGLRQPPALIRTAAVIVVLLDDLRSCSCAHSWRHWHAISSSTPEFPQRSSCIPGKPPHPARTRPAGLLAS